MSVKTQSANQSQEVGIFSEEEANRKRQRREHGKMEIKQAVDTARASIIHGRVEEANRLVFDKMTETIKKEVFGENSIELLPAYFVLAEANICMGSSRLKKAEEFLIAAYWNLLKYTSDENEKGQGQGQDEALVDENEIQRYRANLHKTFGRLFLAQNRPQAMKQALEELSQGIYLECQEFGPESIYLCSSYYYMGELFKKKEQNEEARAFYQKIIQIWKRFILEKDFRDIEDFQYQSIDELYYEEAREHLKNILVFFEIEYGPQDTLTAECQFSFGLVMLKTGNVMPALEFMQKAHIIYTNNLGEFENRTKEVEEVIQRVETLLKEVQE